MLIYILVSVYTELYSTVYIYICQYINIDLYSTVYIYMSIYLYINMSRYQDIKIHTDLCVYTNLYNTVCIYMSTCQYTYWPLYIQAYIPRCLYIDIYVNRPTLLFNYNIFICFKKDPLFPLEDYPEGLILPFTITTPYLCTSPVPLTPLGVL